MSQVRQNYHEDSEKGINKQINLELYAMYTYMSMVTLDRTLCGLVREPFILFSPQSFYFERDDVALPGFAKYFRKASAEEMDHAKTFMKFQNDRGGRVVFQDIKKPAKDAWGNGLEAMQAALELEKTVNQALLDLHKIADHHGDFRVSSCGLFRMPCSMHAPFSLQMADFIEGNFLGEQVDAIKELGDYITTLKRVGPGPSHGEYHFDRETLGGE